MFVTTADFENAPLNLPNLTKVVNSFADFVTEQEEEAYSKLLGVRFWEAFKTGFAAIPSAWVGATAYVIGNKVLYADEVYEALLDSTGVTPGTDPLTWDLQAGENRWHLLVAGALYSYEDVDYKWVGMEALTKPLIYSKWLEYVVSDQVSGVGTVKGKSENAESVSSNHRICRAWNTFDDLACGRLSGGVRLAPMVNSLYGYLYANAEDFDDVVTPEYTDFEEYLENEFRPLGRKNVFDL